MDFVSEYQGQRELLLTPSKDHQSLAEAQVGMHGSPGIGHFDSNMADSAGNIYQCVNEDGEILPPGDQTGHEHRGSMK